MKAIYKESNYVADPHGAIGYLGLQKHGLKDGEYGVFLETAHPVKFLPTVEATLDIKVPLPAQIEAIMDKEKIASNISTYEELKEYLNK